jgi:hypothetical protein
MVTFRLADSLPRSVLDRYIRNPRHYADAIDYVENNPVKARLCSHREDWEFSSARMRMAYASDKCGQDARAPGK